MQITIKANDNQMDNGRGVTHDAPQILIPYDPREAISAKEAARRAGCCAVNIKAWCEDHGIGRKVAGRWQVSAPALAMYLESNLDALAAYHLGERSGELVGRYFIREGLNLRKI
jgi:hypothetical protein